MKSIFPTIERVIYKENPLEEVAFRTNFPGLAEIESQIPAQFHIKLGREYGYNRRLESQLPSEFLAFCDPETLKKIAATVHSFASQDNRWLIELTKDSLTVTDYNYQNWEEFSERLRSCWELVVSVYTPKFASTLGLRYKNVIKRSQLGLLDLDWADLLEPYISAEMCSEPLRGKTFEMATRKLILPIANGHALRLNHGLAESGEQKEICYVIDSAFYTSAKTELTHVYETLDYFNQESGRLFRWCIQDRLHKAMGPRSV